LVRGRKGRTISSLFTIVYRLSSVSIVHRLWQSTILFNSRKPAHRPTVILRPAAPALTIRPASIRICIHLRPSTSISQRPCRRPFWPSVSFSLVPATGQALCLCLPSRYKTAAPEPSTLTTTTTTSDTRTSRHHEHYRDHHRDHHRIQSSSTPSTANMSNIDHSRDGETKVPEIVSIVTVCCTLTSTLVILRIVTRAWIVRAFGPDDWVLVVAQVFAVAAAVAIGLGEPPPSSSCHRHRHRHRRLKAQNNTLAWAIMSGPSRT
jgi:hypothetical protein